MNEAGAQTSAKTDGSPAKPAGPQGQVVLVMQGGGALGAYQGGVYQALHEAGIEPDWVIGTSIGAVNGAIIAFNAIEHRLERLRTFWERVERDPPPGLDLLPPQLGRMSANLMAWFGGVPGFFAPNPALALGIERAAIYSTSPLKATLADLMDFDLDAAKHPRFTLGLVNVASGEFRYFDSRRDAIKFEHVLAATALPPSFPAIRIDGDLYWDGGIYSNTPIEAVFDDNPRRDSVIFAVQLWHDRGPIPDSVLQVLSREKDITFASRTKSHIVRQAQIHKLRHIVRELVRNLPKEKRETPEMKVLAGYGCTTNMHLIEINAPILKDDGFSRDFDFSRATLEMRWQAGYADTHREIERRPWEKAVNPIGGIAVHASDGKPVPPGT
jgi:NTE family protein